MKKSFAAVLLIFAFASFAFCQISGQQPFVSIDSLPVPDALPKEKQPIVREPAALKEVDYGKSQGVNRQEDEPSERAWVSAEYLLWKMRGSNLPPLITVAPGDRFTAQLDEPGTVIAFGGDRLDQGRFPGARLTAGLWLNNRKTLGAEVTYFFLEKKTFNFQVSSSGLPGSQTISRPYIFVDLSRPNRIDTFEAASPIAAPSELQTNNPRLFSGTGTGTFSSRLQGAEASLLYRLGIMRCCRMVLLTGFRYLDLNQALTVASVSNIGGGGVTPPFQESLIDQFNTRNQFYGGQAGLRSTLSEGRLSLELSGTVALGSNRQTVNIRGSRSSTSALNVIDNAPSGLLAFVSNVGLYSRNQFTFLPEVRADIGFDLTRAIRPFIGYQFLYWNKVVMPGEQIDRFVNLALLVSPDVGLRRPAFSFNDTRFWAQGLTTGVKVRF